MRKWGDVGAGGKETERYGEEMREQEDGVGREWGDGERRGQLGPAFKGAEVYLCL